MVERQSRLDATESDMAYTARTDAQWVTINHETLPADAKAKFETYKAQYRATKAAREEFEQFMQQGVEDGQRMIFGYNFGKLSVALVDDDRKAKAPAKSPVTLAQFLANRKAEGRAA